MIKRIDLDKMITDIAGDYHTKLICDNCSEPLAVHKVVGIDVRCPNQPGCFESKWLGEAYQGSWPPFM